MTNEEIDRIVEKIYLHVKNVPGVDRVFIRKCLIGIDSLHDKEVESKIKQLMIFF